MESMKLVWQWFWQATANHYFYRYIKTKNVEDMKKYLNCVEIKFFRKPLGGG
jgi:hypothetical protein